MSCRGPAPNPSSETEREATRTLLIARFYFVGPDLGRSRNTVGGDGARATFLYFSTEFLADTGIIHPWCSSSSWKVRSSTTTASISVTPFALGDDRRWPQSVDRVTSPIFLWRRLFDETESSSVCFCHCLRRSVGVRRHRPAVPDRSSSSVRDSHTQPESGITKRQ